MKWRPIAFVFPWVVSLASQAGAQTADDATREASKHFRRGVSLYAEANYAAALIEFKRALSLAPNATTLYNVGETQFQLQDYAGALSTFQHYLAEAPPSDSHRPEVESDMRTLTSRVGRVRVTTVPGGADISVDDQLVGRTPMDEPLVLSVGRRKLAATVPGRPPVTRYLDVAADDDLSVALQVPAGEPTPPAPEHPASAPVAASQANSPDNGATLRTAGWIGTGVLGAGAIVFGAIALSESKQLGRDRAAFPTSSDTLNREANLTSTYSVLADSLAIAAVVVGGATFVWTLTAPSDRTMPSPAPTARLLLGPASVGCQLTF